MIRIVSDSSIMYSIKEAAEKGVSISPLSVTINDKTYKEYEEINTEEFIDIINKGHLPISSQPAIGEVVDIYNSFIDEEIINITMADGLSGTYGSASMAKDLSENPERITVINSKTLCGPHRYLVLLAQKLSEMGKNKDEILKEINELIETSQSFLIPNDFDYLVRGGRLSPLVGRIGSAIKLVPVMELSEDRKRLAKFTTKRTFPKAIEKICDAFNKGGINKDYKIYVSHACREDLANTAKDIIEENISGIEVEVNKLGPAFTTQGGPGCISVQYIKKHSTLN